MTRLDVLVIGGGTAGIYAARAAKRNARSVGVVEKGQVGGDCIFHACIPTKAMVVAARTLKNMRKAGIFGLPAFQNQVNYASVKAYKDGLVSKLGQGRAARLEKHGIKVYYGTARFISPNEVKIDEEVISADRIIVCTGSVPIIPEIPGLKESGFITSIEALELEKVPEKLAIIGGGPIGVEFAQMFASFGSQVSIFEAADRILAVEDEEITKGLTESFARDGVSVFASARIMRVEKTASGRVLTFKESAGDEKRDESTEILIATGRTGAIQELDLAAAGIKASRKGIETDQFLQTNVPHIYAAGDVAGSFQYTLIAWEQGEVAGHNATSDDKRALDYRVLPRATYCDPEVGSVGLTESQAREQGFEIKIGRYNYFRLGFGIISDKTEGLVKIIVEADSGRILGGHIIGADASNLIHEVAVAVSRNLTYQDIGNTFHAYPTYSEGVRYACQSIK